ncbi:hypothetical protein SPI_01493 [Niveomyces insectorum RCEF 264]|uniref:Metallo-beta-lactamase domain-containing protein n=1 Tax=Niveomyces insectorum RCEF 264 TaxID=1081102 RepID=A0A167Z086_9HYPO|nr:hypothetical protein SPI_01493 [Niveomyces insectorum RCEF 264]
MANPAPNLHVVYAGRGDAFILEYGPDQARRYILMDAGPRTYSYQNRTWAPYYNYLKSAADNIMRGTPFTAVVLSHADEDHWGGFQEQYVNAAGNTTAQKTVYVPNNGLSEALLERVLSVANRTWRGVLRPALKTDPLVGNMVSIYPKRQALLGYNHPNSFAWTNTDQPDEAEGTTNDSSILLYTRDPNVPNENPIFFTGDSSAPIIVRNMEIHWPHMNMPRFAIYKIQHHGSILDAQYPNADPYFTNAAQDECRVFMMLRYVVEPRPGLLPKGFKDGALKAAGELLRTEILKNRTAKYFHNLKRRQIVYHAWIQDQNNAGGVMGAVNEPQRQPRDPTIPGLSPKPYQLLEKFWDALDDKPKNAQIIKDMLSLLVYDNSLVEKARLYGMTDHWGKIWDDGGTWDLMYEKQVAQAKNFYMQFTADTYVVSANYKYAHPSAQTLLGLGLAVMEQNRAARLYVTSGYSIDVDRMENIAGFLHLPMLDQTLPLVPQIFRDEHLQIYYLNESAYMTLSGTTDQHPRVDRETRGVTRKLDFANHAHEARRALHKTIEKDPIVARRNDRLFQVTVVGTTQPCYLSLVNNNGPTVATLVAHKVKPLKLLERIRTLGSENIIVLQNHANPPLSVRIGIRWVRATEVAENGQWEIWDENFQRTFYRSVLNQAILFDRPLGSPAVAFRFTDEGDALKPEHLLYPNSMLLTVSAVAKMETKMERVDVSESSDTASRTVDSMAAASTAETAPNISAPSHLVANSGGHNATAAASAPPSASGPTASPTSGSVSGPMVATATHPSIITLAHFLTLRRIEHVGANITASQAIKWLVGDANYDALLFRTPKVASHFLNAPVDAQKSVVHATADAWGIAGIASANLSPRDHDGATTIQVENETVAVTDLSIKLQWPSDGNLELKMTAKTNVGIEISITRAAKAALPPPDSLDKALLRAGVKDAELKDIGLPHLLSILVQDSGKIHALLSTHLPVSLLKAGFANLKPDLAKSTGIVLPCVTGDVVVDKAVVVCKPGSAGSGWHDDLELGGLKFSLGPVSVVLDRIGLADASISVEASPKLLDATGKVLLQLTMSCLLTAKETTAFTFRAGVHSLDVLASALTKDTHIVEGIVGASVPLQAATKSSIPTLGKAPKAASRHEIGFTVTQPISGIADCKLETIFLTTQFEDWVHYLPVPEKFHNIQAQARITVWHPLRLSTLRVGVDVHLSLPVSSNKHVDVVFSAAPLENKGDYQYRLDFKAEGRGVTIHDVCAAVGFHEGADKDITDIPLLKGAIEKVHIRHFSVVVAQSKDKVWQFTDWAVDVALPSPIQLIEKKLVMEGVELSAEKINGFLTATGSALFHEEQSKQTMRVAFALPIHSTPGYVRVDSPNGSLSLEGLLAMFNLTPFADVPVLTTLLKTKLKFFELSLQATDKSHKVVGFQVKLELPEHDIGPLKLEAVRMSASWTAAGPDETLAGAPQNRTAAKKSHVYFTVGALLKGSGVATVVTYDSRKHALEADITTQPNKPVRIADLLAQIVSDKNSTALDAVVGDVAIRSAKLVLDTKAKHVQKCVLNVVRGGTIQLPDAKSPQGLQLSFLTVRFHRTLASPEKQQQKKQQKKPRAQQPSHDSQPVHPVQPTHPKQQNQPSQPGQPSQYLQPSPQPTKPVQPSPPPSHNPPQDTTPHPPPSYSTTFGVDGLIRVGKSQMKCALTCTWSAGKDASTDISFTVTPAPTVTGSPATPISLTDLAETFKLGSLGYERPADLPSFDVGLENIHGKIRSARKGTGTTPTLSLTEFRVKVRTHGTLDLLAEPKLSITKLYLAARYPDSKKRFAGTIFGRVSIGENVGAWLRFSRKDGVSEFRGSTVKRHAGVTVSHVFSRFLASDDHDASAISTPLTSLSVEKIHVAVRPGDSYFVSARGATPAPGAAPITKGFHNFDIRFRNLGAKIKVTKVKQSKTAAAPPPQKGAKPPKTYTSRVFLSGAIDFPGFASASALLRIDPGKDAILTAVVTRSAEAANGSELTLLTDKVLAQGATPTESWETVLGQANALRFGDSGARLFVNFTKKTLLVAGAIDGLGAVLLYIKARPQQSASKPAVPAPHQGQHAAGFDYFFSLSATNIDRIWKHDHLKSDISSAFHIQRVVVHAMSGEQGSSSDSLKGELKACQDLMQDGLVDADFDKADSDEPETEEKIGTESNNAGGPIQMSKPQGKKPVTRPTRKKAAPPKTIDVTGLEPPLQKNTPLGKGAWFFAEIGFQGNSDMSQALQMCAENPQASGPGAPQTVPLAKVVIFGRVSANPQGTKYGASIRNLTLAGGHLTINGDGAYKPAHVVEVPQAKEPQKKETVRRLTLQAEVQIKGLRTPLTLYAGLVVERDLTEIVLHAGAGGGLVNPFDGMFNITMTKLEIRGKFTKHKKSAAITGHVRLGSHGDEKHPGTVTPLVGTIICPNGRPAIFSMVYHPPVRTGPHTDEEKSLTASDVVSDIVLPGNQTPGQAPAATPWSDELPPVRLESAVLYYNASTEYYDEVAKIRYHRGFCVGANVDVFGVPVAVRVNVSREGLSISGMVKGEIQVVFGALRGKLDENSPTRRTDGPEILIVALRNKQKIFKISAGIEMLGLENLPDVEFSYRSQQKRITGDLTLTAEPFTGAHISFYYHNKHLHFENFSFSHLIPVDLDECLNVASKMTLCGRIVDRLFNKAVKTKFHFSMKTSHDPSKLKDKDKLHLEVTWKYEVLLLDKSLGVIHLGDTPLEIAKSAKDEKGHTKSFLTRLTEFALDNTVLIGEKLLSNPAEFGKILGAVAGKTLTIRVITTLFCRDVQNPEFARRILQIFKRFIQECVALIEELVAILQDLKTAITNRNYVRAVYHLARLLIRAGEALVYILAVIAVLVALDRILKNDPKAKKEIEDYKKQAEAHHDKAKGLQTERDQLEAQIKKDIALTEVPRARFAAGSADTVEVDWTKGLPTFLSADEKDKVEWIVTYSTTKDYTSSTSASFPVKMSEATKHAHQDPQYAHVTVVYVRIQARVKHGYKKGEETKPDNQMEDDVHPHSEAPKDYTLCAPVNCVAASHSVTYPTPTGLTAAIKTGDATTCVFSAPDLAPGTYELRLVRVGAKADEEPLWSSTKIVESKEKWVDEVTAFSKDDTLFGDSGTGAVQGSIRRLVTDERSLFRPSEWAMAVPLTIAAQVYTENLAAMMDGKQIKLSWTNKGIAVPQGHEFKVYVYRDDTLLETHVQHPLGRTVTTAKGNSQTILDLSVPVPLKVEKGEIVTLSVAPVDPLPDRLCILAQEDIDIEYLPSIRLNEEWSRYYIGTNQLMLVVSYEYRLAAGETMQVKLEYQNMEPRVVDIEDLVDATFENTTATMSINDTAREWPQPIAVTVTTKNETGTFEVTGPTWTLPDPPPSIPLLQNAAAQQNNTTGKIEIRWDCDLQIVQTVVVVATRQGAVVLATTVYAAPKLSVLDMAISDPSAPKEACEYSISLSPIFKGIYWGPEVRTTCWTHPGYGHWTESRVADEISTPLAAKSGLAAIVRPNRKKPTMFWTDSAGFVRSASWESTPPHHPVCNPQDHHQPNSSLAVAAVSGAELHEEVYWIHRDGSVRASVWGPDKAWDSNRLTYKFGQPGEAVTAHGGSIAAAVELGKCIHVWWVGPVHLPKLHKTINTVKHSIWDNGWQPVENWDQWSGQHAEETVGPARVHMTNQDISPLVGATCRGYATVWFVHASGELRSVTRNGRLPSNGSVFYDGGAPASVQAGIGILSSQPPGEYGVFWITRNGDVLSACDKAETWNSHTVSAVRRVAGPDAASVRSDIAVLAGPHGGDLHGDLYVFWFDPTGRLMGSYGARSYSLYHIVWSAPFEIAPAGSGRSHGRQLLRITTWGKPTVRLWWVDGNERVRYSEPTLTFQG